MNIDDSNVIQQGKISTYDYHEFKFAIDFIVHNDNEWSCDCGNILVVKIRDQEYYILQQLLNEKN